MSENEIIQKTSDGPVTVESLMADLAALGVGPGMTLLVHSSLSALGWVCGGAAAVILALENLLGPQGTLVMPTHSGDLSDPAEWENPPVPQSWWRVIRQTMPAFEPDLTPSRGMGIIPETFRKQRNVFRSSHPHFSFAAWGAQAQMVTANHSLEFGLGENSPLARIYELDGWVLLLGVGHDSNTSLHLAEYRADYPGKQIRQSSAPVRSDGERQWLVFQDVELDSSDFARIGEQFGSATGLVKKGKVGGATALLMSQRQLVDFAVRWLEQHRRRPARRSSLFDRLVDEAIHQDFIGWDFSFIAKRYVEDPPSWDYQQQVQARIAQVEAMLDLGTGGGEFLSTLRPLPPHTWAVETYPPNIPIARARLEPLNVRVTEVEALADLPFEATSFELVIARHECFLAGEIYRILQPGGLFITEQVGGQNNLRLNELLQEQVEHPFMGWQLAEAVKQLTAAGFEIIQAREEFPESVFYDIGAVVYYLKAIGWQIPDFSAAQYYDRLQTLHQTIQSNGGLAVKSHRFYIEARKP